MVDLVSFVFYVFLFFIGLILTLIALGIALALGFLIVVVLCAIIGRITKKTNWANELTGWMID